MNKQEKNKLITDIQNDIMNIEVKATMGHLANIVNVMNQLKEEEDEEVKKK